MAYMGGLLTGLMIDIFALLWARYGRRAVGRVVLRIIRWFRWRVKCVKLNQKAGTPDYHTVLRCTIACVLLALSSLLATSVNATHTAQRQRHYLPLVSSNARYSWHIEEVGRGHLPSMALDATGQPHIAYVTGDRILTYVRRNGTTWDHLTVDAVSGAHSPVLKFDSKDQPHIAYISGTGMMTYASLNGAVWTHNTVGRALSPSVDLAISQSDNIAFIASGDSVIHQDYVDETWWLAYAIPNRSSSDPQIAFGTRGPLHVLYKAYADDTRSYVLDYATFDTVDWSSVERVTPVSTSHIELVVDRANIPHVVATPNCTECGGTGSYLTKSGSTWIRRQFAVEEDPAAVALALDSTDTPHIAYTTGRGRTRYIAFPDGTERVFPNISNRAMSTISLGLTNEDIPVICYVTDSGWVSLATLVDHSE